MSNSKKAPFTSRDVKMKPLALLAEIVIFHPARAVVAMRELRDNFNSFGCDVASDTKEIRQDLADALMKVALSGVTRHDPALAKRYDRLSETHPAQRQRRRDIERRHCLMHVGFNRAAAQMLVLMAEAETVAARQSLATAVEGANPMFVIKAPHLCGVMAAGSYAQAQWAHGLIGDQSVGTSIVLTMAGQHTYQFVGDWAQARYEAEVATRRKTAA